MALFSLMETVSGRAGILAMLSLILMSPLCEYFTNVFGFPIRLQLTQMAGYILHSVDNGYRSEGNVLFNGTAEFSVDTACMGLHMLISSLLTGMILLGIYQRRLGKTLSFLYLSAIGVAVLILNLFSNLIRIVANLLSKDNDIIFQQNCISILSKLSSEDAILLDSLHNHIELSYNNPVINAYRLPFSGNKNEPRHPLHTIVFDAGGIMLSKGINPEKFEYQMSNLVSLGLLKWETEVDLSPNDDSDVDSEIYRNLSVDVYNNSSFIFTKLGDMFVRACKQKISI